ncbi:4-hydroxy-3-methylbut-2-enyl diphosphate reductase [bacterium J17]|nr:4-hydroxy-3-methylbut-2-enyl diphosphate reductase [bacterium J17]
MPRKFNVPEYYRSSIIAQIKSQRSELDPRKKDFRPSVLDFGPVRFKIARHFGFCFGVENAIEIAYRAIEENPDKRIYLLSEMIHNPGVNSDLQERGVQFLMRNDGTYLVDFNTLQEDDIVIVPAFGTTVEIQEKLSSVGIDPYYYDTTCPFVEKVWKRAGELGKQDHTVIVHGKRAHEETRATFSHSKESAPTLIVRDFDDTRFLIDYIKGKKTTEEFMERFSEAASANFQPEKHLKKVGVVNQTTMLATETKAIAKMIRSAMIELYGEENIKEHFADTRDTLCYATYENQNATRALIDAGADLSIVVGGYNSSNTSHLVELCEEVMPTFYIRNSDEIKDETEIKHFNLESKSVIKTDNWLPTANGSRAVDIALTSGASCPDSEVDKVLQKVLGLFPNSHSIEKALELVLVSG